MTTKTRATKKAETPETNVTENYDFKTLEKYYNENALIRIARAIENIEMRLYVMDRNSKRTEK